MAIAIPFPATPTNGANGVRSAQSLMTKVVNGRIVTEGDEYDELGTLGLGLAQVSGFVAKAYIADLYWPQVYPVYNRIRHSDPEITVIRQIFDTMAAGTGIEPDLPEKPSDADKRFQQFIFELLDDLEGGIKGWLSNAINYTPFMGWAWWEAVPAIRKENWTPPDSDEGGDDWRSRYDDGLIGFRRLAFRDHSSFFRWELTQRTGRLLGMWQLDYPNTLTLLPLSRAVHLTFGDSNSNNPEGLTPSEALFRLERIKYGLEVVQGIGFEHAAGHLSIEKTSEGALSPDDKANIKAAARHILTAQEGNYSAWPNGFKATVVDVPFSAAPSILDAIRYYSLLKLALFNMQWVGMSTVSNTGSYSALKDSTALWLVAYNAMVGGFVSQLDKQLVGRAYEMNKSKFAGMTTRPKLIAKRVEKLIDLQEAGAFLTTIKDILPLGDDDFLEIRSRSGFLPETLPTPAEEKTIPGQASGQPPQPPTPQQLQATWHKWRERKRARLVELSSMVELAKDFGAVRDAYYETVNDAILKYLVSSGSIATYKNSIKHGVVESFPDGFYAGYAEGGGEDVDSDDDKWLTARINSETGNIDSLFERLKAFRDEAPAPRELVAEADRRAEAYSRSLDGVFSEGKLRGAKNKMVTWQLGNTEQHCSTCKMLNGKRHSAKWFISRNYIPGKPGSDTDCGGYNCDCALLGDDGEAWVGSL